MKSDLYMAKTFISYESHDKEIAFKVCEYLESRGLTCWIAPRDIHAGEYAGEIVRAIKEAGSFVVVVSSGTSRSAHVRNEVSLAFESGCTLVPFMLEDVTLDDSLKYYFAGKQRVSASGKTAVALDNLYNVLAGQQIELPMEEQKQKKSGWRWVFILVLLAVVIAAMVYAAHRIANKDSVATVSQEEKQEMTDSSVVVEMVEEAVPSAPKQARTPAAAMTSIPVSSLVSVSVPTDADRFSGKTISGYPDGRGKYEFRKVRRIDMHDTKERMAEPGDYVVGEWQNGHLIQGKWYCADGTLKEVVIIGKAPDPETDHVLGKCAGL